MSNLGISLDILDISEVPSLKALVPLATFVGRSDLKGVRLGTGKIPAAMLLPLGRPFPGMLGAKGFASPGLNWKMGAGNGS